MFWWFRRKSKFDPQHWTTRAQKHLRHALPDIACGVSVYTTATVGCIVVQAHGMRNVFTASLSDEPEDIIDEQVIPWLLIH